RIRALLGAGGMGEVYLAEDERLQRPVAMKVLTSGDRTALPEARAASALNHPNVAHIYDVGELDDIVFIAMEYVEGVTLETRLVSGPLPIHEAIDIAAQLADALVDAHAKGIIHRDLKPENIVINQRGQAKILDFGLAKMLLDETISAEAPNVIRGTVPYMSPEQTRAKALDHRSDIFSFGVILYEMIAGARPFDGPDVLHTLRNIAELPARDIDRADVPDVLRKIIAKCLEKNRDDRYETPAQLVADLHALRDKPKRRNWIAITAIAIVIVAAIMMVSRRENKPKAKPRVVKITAASGLEDEPALSPDGQSIAYTSDERGNLDIFVRRVAGGEPTRLLDDDADDAQPAWSPDGTRIAFVSARNRGGRLSIVLGQALGNFVNAQGGDLFVVPARGGNAVKLIDNAFYPAWSPDAKWIVFQSPRGGRWDIWKIAASGGAPLQLTSDRDFDYQPSWSPDGKSIVYGSGMPAPYVLKIIPANGGAARAITDGKDGVLLRPIFAADSRSILYSSTRGGSLNLWRLALKEKSTPEQLTLGEGDDVCPSIGADGKRIAYATARQTADLWSIDVAGGKSEQLTFDTGDEEFPHRSVQGVLVFASDRSGKEALWLRDPNGTMRMLIARPAAGQPRWSPDGKRLAYRAYIDGKTSLVIRDAGGEERVIAKMAESPSWSPDGKWIAYTSWERQTQAQIHVASADGAPQPRQLTKLPLTTSYPTWSPDGRQVVFQATRDDGARHLWIVDVATGRVRALTSGASEDSHPQWSPMNPDRILFVRNHKNLMSVSVATGEVRAMTSFAEPNMILDYPSWSMDGTRVDFSIARKRGDLYMLEEQ
ncbi:MAG TPA: protein kinase, partial [Thermoanaerobaculia bacterium]|nr:protein kinase [Thermoanaerobaculia bacterium]